MVTLKRQEVKDIRLYRVWVKRVSVCFPSLQNGAPFKVKQYINADILHSTFQCKSKLSNGNTLIIWGKDASLRDPSSANLISLKEETIVD